MDINDKNYGTLARVLQMAYDQAATGKGNERHGNGLPFHQQPMQAISALLGNYEGLAYQICKKVTEARNLPTKEQRVRELLGVINYAAGMIIYEDLDIINTTSLTIDTSRFDPAKQFKLEQEMENQGLLGKGEASRRYAERCEALYGKPNSGEVVIPAVRQVIRDNPVTPNKFSMNPLDSIDVSRHVRGIVHATWLPGVEGGDDYIEVAADKTAMDRSPVSVERVVNNLTDILSDLVKVNPKTPIVLNLAAVGLQNYRGTIVGELLNSEGVSVKDGTGDWDRITVLFNPPATVTE